MAEQTAVQSNIVDNQLVSFNFGQLSFTVYGTEEEPLFKSSDILIHLLKYKQSKDAAWFRNMDSELKIMYIVDHGDNNRYFNIQGIQWAFTNSKNPIGNQFIDQVEKSLKKKYFAVQPIFKKQTLLSDKSGIYIIGYPWNIKKIKIGWSVNINDRIRSYNTVFCGEQIIIAKIKTKQKQIESFVFDLAKQAGLQQNGDYEVFDYSDYQQIDLLLGLIDDQQF